MEGLEDKRTTLQPQQFLDNSKKVETGLDFTLFHFNHEEEEKQLFPRKIMTKELGYQIEVYSREEALEYFQQSQFLDCRVNSFPRYTEYLIFIDFDRNNNFDSETSFHKAICKTLKNIKEKLNDGYPTVLDTGGRYHIILPIEVPMILENITEFQEFDNPSEQFLRFCKDYLSNGKADKNNNPSFKSCLLRIPGSINSKYNTKVSIVQKWNGIRAPITKDLLIEFRRYLIQKKIDQDKQRQKILLNMKDRNISCSNNSYISWIEHLLQSPIEDYRKLVIDLILAPYLINIRKLSYSESYQIIREWIDKCNELNRLDNYRNFVNCRINYALKNAMNKGIPPMSREKIKTDPVYSELYQILQIKLEKLLL